MVNRARLMIASLVIIAAATLLGVPGNATQSGLFHPKDAYAIQPCWDKQCNAHDPHTTRCDTQGTYVVAALAADNTYHYDDQLWYSNWCGANWGNTLNELCDQNGCPSGITFQSTSSGSYSGTWNDGYQVDNHTLMLAGYSTTDRVCRPYIAVCTYWY